MFFTTKTKSDVAVILKRQVPIRFDEPARSWLGGLPQMPQDIPWPYTTDDDPTPLHFLAQICCADLPRDLWGGAGPRKGWLLLFAQTMMFEDEIENGSIQVLHIDSLGPEREPPDEMPTVRHTMSDYIDYHTPVIREGVPKMWRRWPVDLVAREIPAPDPGSDGWGPPIVREADLYDAPVDVEYVDELAGQTTDGMRLLTWRGVLYCVDGILRAIGPAEAERNVKVFDLRGAAGFEPGWIAQALTAIEAGCSEAGDYLAGAEKRLLALPADASREDRRRAERQVQSARHDLRRTELRREDLAPFAGPGGEEALAAQIDRDGAAYLAKLAAQRAALESLRAEALAQDLDARLGDEDESRINGILAGELAYWMKDQSFNSVMKVRTSLVGRGKGSHKMALREDLLDLYARDAASRALIPPDLLARLEPKVRHVDDYLHWMGGPRSPLQEVAESDDDPLIFQLASDRAMGWMWGDAGILLVHMKPRLLKAGRFDRVYGWIEGH